jgi:methionine-rich copper-binding protein CopC
MAITTTKRSLLSILFARFVRSMPGPDALLATPPERVEIWFAQELFRRQGENWIRVFGPGDAAVHRGEAQIDDDDRAHMWVELQEDLPDGEYRVSWRNLSAEDGDTDEGLFTFSVDPQAVVTSTPMLAVTATSPSSPEPQDTAIQPATVTTRSPDNGDGETGCFLGLAPLLGVLALVGATTGKRKR